MNLVVELDEQFDLGTCRRYDIRTASRVRKRMHELMYARHGLTGPVHSLFMSDGKVEWYFSISTTNTFKEVDRSIAMVPCQVNRHS